MTLDYINSNEELLNYLKRINKIPHEEIGMEEDILYARLKRILAR